MSSNEMARCLRLMERMVNHNLEHEIYTDFKYWEDASDQYRDGTGSVLPLWRFASESTRSKHVTCLRWHPKFADLFAVSYGSYDFMRQGSGLIYCYSLKVSFPPYRSPSLSLSPPLSPSLLFCCFWGWGGVGGASRCKVACVSSFLMCNLGG